MEPVLPYYSLLIFVLNFYPQAPHGACQSYFSSALKIYLISILRLRMEPVKMQAFLKNLCEYFYPQAPHGACPSLIRRIHSRCNFYPQAPHGACLCFSRNNNSRQYFYPQAPHGACQQKTPKICPIVIASFCNITNNMPIKNRFFTTLHILFSSFPVRISYEFHVHFTFAPENLIQYVNQFLFFLKFHQKLPVQAPQVHVQ